MKVDDMYRFISWRHHIIKHILTTAIIRISELIDEDVFVKQNVLWEFFP